MMLSAYYLLAKYADNSDFLHIKRHNNMQEEVQKMHRFDYSFLDNGMLPAGLLNITTDIYSLRVTVGFSAVRSPDLTEKTALPG